MTRRVAVPGRAIRSVRVRMAVAVLAALPLGSHPTHSQPPAPSAPATGEQTARPEIARPLEAAGVAIRDQRFDEADALIAQTEAVANRTPYETMILLQTRGVLAQARGDVDGAIAAFAQVLATGRLAPADRARLERTLGLLAYQKADFGAAAAHLGRAISGGDRDPALPPLLLQATFQAGDCAGALAQVGAAQAAQASRSHGNAPPVEAHLQVQAACARKAGDEAAYRAAIEGLAAHYPSRDVWLDLVGRVQRRPEAVSRYALGLSRVRRQLGLLSTPAEVAEAAQLALASGFPGEAQRVMAGAIAAHVLTEPLTGRDKRLQDFIAAQQASDAANLDRARSEAEQAHGGDALVRVGYDMATQDRPDGIPLILRGIAAGGLTNPDRTRLLLGAAYVDAGRTPEAVAVFRQVAGADGAADIARLWLLSLGALSR